MCRKANRKSQKLSPFQKMAANHQVQPVPSSLTNGNLVHIQEVQCARSDLQWGSGPRGSR